MDKKIENLKWQIEGETSVSQIMLWSIVWKLFGGWVGYIALFMIIGNIFTLLKSCIKLYKNDIDYFK